MSYHPNKTPFLGILAAVDAPSDKAPAGARGHRVLLTRDAAEKALPSLIGMGINMPASGGHSAETKVGVIEKAELDADLLWVTGYLWGRDCPRVISAIQASSEQLGMSYEIVDAFVPDMWAAVWTLERVTFTGAAVLPRAKAAYRIADFTLLEETA